MLGNKKSDNLLKALDNTLFIGAKWWQYCVWNLWRKLLSLPLRAHLVLSEVQCDAIILFTISSCSCYE